MGDNENAESEKENESEEELEEEEDEEEDVEQLEGDVKAVDAFTELKNMYRPVKDAPLEENNEKVEVKETLKDTKDSDEYSSEEEMEGSDCSEDEDIEEEEEEEISDVDDDDLMKRLESKYGKLPDRDTSDDEETEEKWTSNFKN